MRQTAHPILSSIVQRLALGLLTLFLVTIVIFGSVELLPGSYAHAVLGNNATPEAVAALERKLGLDQPAWLRYVQWIGGVLRGDFGTSYAGNDRSVIGLIGGRLSNTLFLATLTALIAVPLALVLGILTALYRNSWLDRVLNGLSLGAVSFPEFFLAYLLTFAVVLRSTFSMLPMAERLPDWLSHGIEAALSFIPHFPILANVPGDAGLAERIWICALPALTLILAIVAHMMRMTRASIINVLGSPYIEMARLNGESDLNIVMRHALPNAWAAIANAIAFNLAYLIVGAVVVEVVFVYPGIGQLMVDAVRSRDIPVVQACALIFAATYIFFNLCADIVSVVTNPRLLHPR